MSAATSTAVATTGSSGGGGGGDAVFEISDFTTSSPWERFIADLEQIIRTWGLADGGRGKPLPGSEVSESEVFMYNDNPYLLTRYDYTHGSPIDVSEGTEHFPTAMHQWMDPNGDFPAASHTVRRWFGVSHYLLLRHLDESTDTDVSEACGLLSALTIASDYARSEVPVFVPTQPSWRGGYIGYVSNAETGVHARLECDSTFNIPPSYRHLAGLLNVFHNNIGVVDSTFEDGEVATAASVRLTFMRGGDWYDWRREGRPPPSLQQQLRQQRAKEPLKAMAGALFSSGAVLGLGDGTAAPAPGGIEDGESGSAGGGSGDFGGDGDESAMEGAPELTTTVWGPEDDPIDGIHLLVTWPCFAEGALVDNEVYSDLDPMNAPAWALRCVPWKTPSCPLADRLAALGQSWRAADKAGTVEELIPSGQLLPAVRRLGMSATDAVPTPVQLDALLQVLFHPAEGEDDALDEHGLKKSDKVMTSPIAQRGGGGSGDTNTPSLPRVRVKAAPPHSLLTKFVMNACLPFGPAGIALFWTEFVREVRWSWDHGVDLPHMDDGPPDICACLIYQKLQMLNCCAAYRRRALARAAGGSEGEAGAGASGSVGGGGSGGVGGVSGGTAATGSSTPQSRAPGSGSGGGGGGGGEGDSSDSDEFFEAFDGGSEEGGSGSGDGDGWGWGVGDDDDQGEDGEDSGGIEPAAGSAAQHLAVGGSEPMAGSSSGILVGADLSTQETRDGDSGRGEPSGPTGRLKPIEGVLLLANGEQAWEPVTQEDGVLTEDMIEEQQEILASLGSSKEATAMRARMQSASLLSDMSAFKAANPGARLEDFVRWHSPRDWEVAAGEEDGRKGHLSTRMQAAGNLWQIMWGEAKAKSAADQKPLFDFYAEAQKALHYLETIPPRELFQQIAAVAFVGAYSVLSESEAAGCVDSVVDQLTVLCSAVNSTLGFDEHDPAAVTELAGAFESAEAHTALATSLMKKLPNHPRIVDALARECEASIDTVKERAAVTDLFVEADGGDGDGGRSRRRGRRGGGVVSTGGDYAALESVLPEPNAREFVLRRVCQRPYPSSAPTGHRLYAFFLGDEVRLATSYALSDE